MADRSEMKRIIWAVDARQDCDEAEKRCEEAIRTIGSSYEIEVEPVYVLPPQRFNSPFEVLYPPTYDYGAGALEALNARMKKVQLPSLHLPRVIDKLSMSTAGAVKELSKYAQETNAHLIVVGAHCRRGVARFFLGSFAESLLLRSRTPLLIVGPQTRSMEKVDSILFPTDFGKTSESVFQRVLEMAKSTNARIDIYHMILKPLVLPNGVVQPVDLDKERAEAEEKLAELVRLAKAADVESETVLELSDRAESEEIIKEAEARGSSMIAMAAQSGAVASTVAGSTTRQVVRASPCPVWVLHAHGLAESKPYEVNEDEIVSELTRHGRERKTASR